MSQMITLPADFLAKTSNFVKQAAPELETSRQEKAAWSQAVPELVDKLIQSGVLRGEKRAEAIKDFTEGGLVKAAQVIDAIADRVTAPSLGQPDRHTKAASAPGGKKESDRVFEEMIQSS